MSVQLEFPISDHSWYLIGFLTFHHPSSDIWSHGNTFNKTRLAGEARIFPYSRYFLLVIFYLLTPIPLLGYKFPLAQAVLQVELTLFSTTRPYYSGSPANPNSLTLNEICLSSLTNVMNNFFFLTTSRIGLGFS